MHITDRERFNFMIKQLFDVYQKPVTDSTINVFWEGLKGFDIKNVSACIEKYMHSNPHVPKPFDIINLCRGNLTYEQNQLEHKYVPVSKEQAQRNIDRFKKMIGEWKPPHPKQWVINILSDPLYSGVGESIARKVYNELSPRELKILDPHGKYQNEI